MGLVIRATAARIEAEFERGRMIAHETACLVGAAFHAPDKMKPYRPLKARSDRAGTSPALGEAKLRGYLMFKALQSAGPHK